MTRAPLTRLDDLVPALKRSGLDPGRHEKLIERVRGFLGRYAALERELLGGIQIAIPRHLLDTEEGDRPEEVVERLAYRERERLDLAGWGERDVMTVLDHEGLKVYRPPFPKGTPLRGLFLFDEAIGPAFIVDGRLPQTTGNAVLAQLYGHYLMDHDPYEIRFVQTGSGSPSARSVRARHFAVAFLIGAPELRSYLRAMDWKTGDPVTPALLEHLSVYFEVDAPTVAARLLSLGLLAAEDAQDLDLGAPASGPEHDTAVPDRFVRLALEAHARHHLTLNELALHLETDVRNAERLASQFRAPDLDSAPPES